MRATNKLRQLSVFCLLLFFPIPASAWSIRSFVGNASKRHQKFIDAGKPPVQSVDPAATVQCLQETATDDQIKYAVDSFTGQTSSNPIIRQYKPQRSWLWRCWHGTIVQHALFVTVFNMCTSLLIILGLRTITARQAGSIWALGLQPDYSHPLIGRLAVFDKVWQYQMNLSTFVLTFFVGQSYQFWRDMYTIGRKIQGRLNDIHLLLATHAVRDNIGRYTAASAQLLEDVGQYSRIFHSLLWASFSRRYRVLLTDRGMSRMVNRGILTERQKLTLQNLELPYTQRYNACLEWMIVRWQQGMQDGTLNSSDGSLGLVLLNKASELRGTYATIGDKLDGRMPLAYVHFVQVLVDSFLFCAPLALYAELGAFSVLSVGLLTLFYSGFLDLGKVFLDPLNNEPFCENSIYMDLGVLVRESNAGSIRWRNGAVALPFETSSATAVSTQESHLGE